MIEAVLSRGPRPCDRQEDVLRRWSCLVAHLICASLGYFSPLAAANAIVHYRKGTPFPCEWYSHICHCKGHGYFNEEALVEIGRDVLRAAYTQRHNHKGSMADYKTALRLVRAEVAKKGITSNMLASWF